MMFCVLKLNNLFFFQTNLSGMYTMPLTLPPDVEARVVAMKRLTKEYYRSDDDQDPVYRALIDSPSTESLKSTLS